MLDLYTEESIEPDRESPYYDLSLFPYTPTKLPIHKRMKYGEVSFYTVFWPTVEPPKARLLFVHGLYEHSILYEELMDKLSQQGFECFFYDQRGCGLTSLGEFKGKTNDHYINKDLNNFINYNYEQIRRKSINLYLVGHSLGGGIILEYLKNGKFKSWIKGGIMTAPLILSDPLTKPPILDNVLKFVNRYSILANYKFISKIKKEYLTTNTSYLDFLVSDKLAIPLVSVSQLVDMFTKGKSLLENSYSLDDNTSILILHSETDKVNSYKGSVLFFEQLPKTDRSIRELVKFEGGHSLFVESDVVRQNVLDTILQFLDRDSRS